MRGKKIGFRLEGFVGFVGMFWKKIVIVENVIRIVFERKWRKEIF